MTAGDGFPTTANTAAAGIGPPEFGRLPVGFRRDPETAGQCLRLLGLVPDEIELVIARLAMDEIQRTEIRFAAPGDFKVRADANFPERLRAIAGDHKPAAAHGPDLNRWPARFVRAPKRFD